jgi:hypothetical protein
MDWAILDRMEQAAAKVRERLLRATALLNRSGLPYAVIGGHAVASWVATVDDGAVRNTRDIDVLIRREDFQSVANAFTEAGFVQTDVLDVPMFLDGPNAKPSESIHVLFAGEKIRAEHEPPAPELTSIQDPMVFRRFWHRDSKQYSITRKPDYSSSASKFGRTPVSTASRISDVLRISSGSSVGVHVSSSNSLSCNGILG